MRYTLSLTCPRCGADVTHVTAGTTSGTSTRSIAHCDPCRDEWLIEVRASSLKSAAIAEGRGNGSSRAADARCGTDSGYHRHRRQNEPTCHACREAHALATAVRNARSGRTNNHRTKEHA